MYGCLYTQFITVIDRWRCMSYTLRPATASRPPLYRSDHSFRADFIVVTRTEQQLLLTFQCWLLIGYNTNATDTWKEKLTTNQR